MTKLKQLAPKHQQLARLLVGGHSQAEICRLLGMHKTSVSRLARDPLVAQEVKRLQALADVNSAICVPGMTDKIVESAHKGMEVLGAILEDQRIDPDIMKLKANVALELLSRAGFGPIKQLNVNQATISGHFTLDSIEEIKQRAKKLFGKPVELIPSASNSGDSSCKS